MKPFFFFVLVALLMGCSGSRNTGDHTGHRAEPNSNPASNTTTANNGTMDHGTAGHGSMTGSPGAETAPFELQFLDSMIAHHKGAIEMAALADTRAQRAEIKELAANIINDQEREIAKMSKLRERWFEGKAEAVNMDFPGMSQSMKGMDMKKLERLRGHDFDLEFIRQMIPHHEGAIEMAKAIRSGDSYAELKELADDVITAQQAEIDQMRGWLDAWQK